MIVDKSVQVLCFVLWQSRYIYQINNELRLLANPSAIRGWQFLLSFGIVSPHT